MRTATLRRMESDDSGTFGNFLTDDLTISLYSAELPWRDNRPGVSCIPEGKYRCVWGPSGTHGLIYHVCDVPGRSNILIHAGNFAGDVSKGLKSSVEGCLCLGRAIGAIGGQKAVLSSKDALAAFEADMNKEPFDLRITRSA